MSDTVKQQILTAIGNTDDNHLKTVLLLMLGILEEIGEKIDMVMTDESTLRDAVLNGHAAVHGEDHDWIKVMRRKEAAKEAANAESFRYIKNGILEKIIWAALAAGAMWYFRA